MELCRNGFLFTVRLPVRHLRVFFFDVESRCCPILLPLIDRILVTTTTSGSYRPSTCTLINHHANQLRTTNYARTIICGSEIRSNPVIIVYMYYIRLPSTVLCVSFDQIFGYSHSGPTQRSPIFFLRLFAMERHGATWTPLSNSTTFHTAKHRIITMKFHGIRWLMILMWGCQIPIN